MSILGTEDISIGKEDVQESRQSSLTTTKSLIFKHQATAGQTLIQLNSLTAPSEALSRGFVQPSGPELASALLFTNKKSFKLHSSRGVWLQMYEDFLVLGNNLIQLVGNIADLGGALEGEVFTGYLVPIQPNTTLITDVKRQWETYELAIGATTTNLGREFKVNANPNQQIGAIRVYRNGKIQYRNVGNATASPSADGNYQEVDGGYGVGVQIAWNVAPVGQKDVIVVDFGYESAGDLSMVGDIESLYTAFKALIADAAPAFGWPESRYLSFNPSQVERRAFGDLLQDLYSVGCVRQVSFTERKDNPTFLASPALPSDNTIPQITEGTEVFNVNFTPKKVGNKLLIDVVVVGAENSNIGDEFTAALFLNGASDAIAAGSTGELQFSSNLNDGTVKFSTSITASGPVNLKVRAGMNNTGNWTLNSLWNFVGSFYNLGNTLVSSIKITEIQA